MPDLTGGQALARALASEGIEVVHVDIDPTAIGRHRPATVGIVGDARPDFARLGEAYGARGVKLRDSADLGKAVSEAVERGEATLVECPLEGEFLEVPPP